MYSLCSANSLLQSTSACVRACVRGSVRACVVRACVVRACVRACVRISSLLVVFFDQTYIECEKSALEPSGQRRCHSDRIEDEHISNGNYTADVSIEKYKFSARCCLTCLRLLKCHDRPFRGLNPTCSPCEYENE